MTFWDNQIAATLVVLAVFVNNCGAEAQANQSYDYTEHEVTLAKIACNEASFRVADTVAITQARGRYSVDELRRMHPRALASGRTDSRRWIETLSADAHRPDGWPEHLVPWETRGKLLWLTTLATVRATLRGERSCAGGQASVWGGRRIDAARIQRLIERGYEVVDCGPTLNSYLRRRS